MSNNWKLILPIIHGIGGQDVAMQQRFKKDVLDQVVQRCGEQLVKDHLVAFLPDWSSTFVQESNAWETLFLFDLVRNQLSDSNLTKEKILSSKFKKEVQELAEKTAWGKITHSWGHLIMAAFVSNFTKDTGLEGIGKAVPWTHIYTIGRDFQANTLSDIILYLIEDSRAKILARLFQSARAELEPLGNTAGTELYLLLCGHSLGSVIAYDLLRAVVKGQTEGLKDPAGFNTTEFNIALGAESWPYAKDLLLRFKPLGLITFGSPVSWFLFRKPDLIVQDDLWDKVCPTAYKDYFSSGKETTPLWLWQNFWHPTDFVAHRCEPYFNRCLAPGCKFVEDIQVPGSYIHGVDAHSSYWGDPTKEYDQSAGKVVKDEIAKRIASLLQHLAVQ